MTKTVVQFGAGAIGRGFLAQLWCDAGYETVFVDVDAALVERFNRAGKYALSLRAIGIGDTRTVTPVRAVLASDTQAVARELRTCAFVATSVGLRHLPGVGTTIAAAVAERSSPLNVLLCENGANVRETFLSGVGGAPIHGIETVVGRMVPEPKPDALDLLTEPFCELPYNAAQWHGDAPDVPGLIAVPGEQFPAYEYRKLFLHNGGHALLAYHGAWRGKSLLSECASDTEIVRELMGFWHEVSTALRQSPHADTPIFAGDALMRYTTDLLTRFQSPHLGDTVARVARDPARKLATHDRLTGAALFCLEHGVGPMSTYRAIAAALRYAESTDEPLDFASVAGLPADHPVVLSVRGFHLPVGAFG